MRPLARDPYHSAMRILLLALMIALLPLRGWAGDLMAMDRATQSLSAGHAPAAPAVPPDCHQAHADGQGLHHVVLPDADQADGHAGADCGSCASCDICHSVALTAVLPQAMAPALPALAPQSSQPRYASAEPAPGFKPPIS